MKHLVELIGTILIAISWLAGIVLAKGFWSTAAAICVPPYAWYLTVERGIVLIGWMPLPKALI